MSKRKLSSARELAHRRKLHRQFFLALVTFIVLLFGTLEYHFNPEIKTLCDRLTELSLLWVANVILVLLEGI